MSGVETAYNVLKKKGKIDEHYKFITFGGDGGQIRYRIPVIVRSNGKRT